MRSTGCFVARAAAAATALTLAAAPLRAQTDEQTLARYRLTEATLAKFAQASRNLVAAAKANPAMLKDEDSDKSAETLADLAAAYDRRAPLKQAITSGGMTTREFATFEMAIFQAGMAAGIIEQQQGKLDNVPAGVPRDNVLFYQRHRAELERIGAALHALEGEKQEPPPEDESRRGSSRS